MYCIKVVVKRGKDGHDLNTQQEHSRLCSFIHVYCCSAFIGTGSFVQTQLGRMVKVGIQSRRAMDHAPGTDVFVLIA